MASLRVIYELFDLILIETVSMVNWIFFIELTLKRDTFEKLFYYHLGVKFHFSQKISDNSTEKI